MIKKDLNNLVSRQIAVVKLGTSEIS